MCSSFDGCRFGRALAALPDLDGDGVPELAVAAETDHNVGSSADTSVRAWGSVFVLFMRADGTVRTHSKIANGLGGLSYSNNHVKDIGGSLATLTLDGAVTLVASSQATNPLGSGLIFLLTLGTDGTVTAQREVRPAAPKHNDWWGYYALAVLPDLDWDGVPEIAVGVSSCAILPIPRGRPELLR